MPVFQVLPFFLGTNKRSSHYPSYLTFTEHYRELTWTLPVQSCQAGDPTPSSDFHLLQCDFSVLSLSRVTVSPMYPCARSLYLNVDFWVLGKMRQSNGKLNSLGERTWLANIDLSRIAQQKTGLWWYAPSVAPTAYKYEEGGTYSTSHTSVFQRLWLGLMPSL